MTVFLGGEIGYSSMALERVALQKRLIGEDVDVDTSERLDHNIIKVECS